jgi:hypothetical protein
VHVFLNDYDASKNAFDVSYRYNATSHALDEVRSDISPDIVWNMITTA